ncbi:MAG: PLP-dependent aminotransferase family protein [Oscillospiraceae bacterium]|nr:PLP-dependent aminotransferase family protein [Oscillospiraceae bacterium]
MLTYTFEKHSGVSLYEQLYRHIKSDILSGRLTAGEKLPSKRTLAGHLEISVITVKNAYEQLAAEGYIFGVEKKGYYVNRVEQPPQTSVTQVLPEAGKEPHYLLDLVTNSISAEYFPFTVWSKTMRQTILEQDKGLLQPTPYNGAPELRRAIADNLKQFRGMTVDPEQIIVGAGTEFLYYLLIQLLGRERTYAVEDPGYGKIGRIYESNQVALRRIGLDDAGLSTEELRKSGADVVHISPSHHYPTGIVMPIGRRQELLRWAGEQEGRYILEDDYDSEFRFVGRPIPTMFSTDEHQRVIYLNTFSKTIAPSIRISYMILPPHLLQEYRKRLSFYACTVSGFEQYTLAQFMAQGRYEQHINRMRNRYRQKRDAVIDAIRTGPLAGRAEIMEQDAGLHFLMKLNTALPDQDLRRRAAENGVRLALLSDYYSIPENAPQHVVVVNYSGIELQDLHRGLKRLAVLLEE